MTFQRNIRFELWFFLRNINFHLDYCLNGGLFLTDLTRTFRARLFSHSCQNSRDSLNETLADGSKQKETKTETKKRQCDNAAIQNMRLLLTLET
jgi:hypothetical protein